MQCKRKKQNIEPNGLYISIYWQYMSYILLQYKNIIESIFMFIFLSLFLHYIDVHCYFFPFFFLQKFIFLYSFSSGYFRYRIYSAFYMKRRRIHSHSMSWSFRIFVMFYKFVFIRAYKIKRESDTKHE